MESSVYVHIYTGVLYMQNSYIASTQSKFDFGLESHPYIKKDLETLYIVEKRTSANISIPQVMI